MTDIDNIIAKILSGEANNTEIAAFEKWTKLDEGNLKKYSDMKSYWESNVRFFHPVSKEDVYQAITEKLHQEQDIPQKTVRVKLLYIATSVAAVAACIIFFMQSKIAADTIHDQEIQYTEFVTTNRIDTIVLPDLSEVILNKNSRLTYSNQFGQKNRNVQIEGEALFDVKRNESLPFVVNLEDNNITVLGTTFNVKSRADKDNIDITLLTGSIKFQTDRNQVILSPSQELIFKKDTKQIEVVESDADCALFWLRGVYKYSSVSVEHLMKALSRTYGVNIQIKSKELASTTVSGAFYKEQSIEEVFSIISRSLPMEWTHVNHNIIIN